MKMKKKKRKSFPLKENLFVYIINILSVFFLCHCLRLGLLPFKKERKQAGGGGRSGGGGGGVGGSGGEEVAEKGEKRDDILNDG